MTSLLFVSMHSFCTKGEVKLYVTIFLTFLALIFTWFAAFDCRFFSRGLFMDSSQGVGLWTYQDWPRQSCVLYRSDNDRFDSSFVFARAVSMMALILSIPVAILASVTVFLESIKRSYLYAQGITQFVLSVLTMLEFVALDSRLCRDFESCHLSVSGAYAIVGAVLWFLAGFATFLVDAGEDKDYRPKQVHPIIQISDSPDASVPVTMEERRTLSDGSTKVVTTTTHPDGSRTVNESIELEGDNGKMVEVPLEDI